MFEKKVSLGHTEIIISIFDSAFIEKEDERFFGFPIGDLESNDYSDIKGSWLKLIIKENKVEVVTDIIATYRMYYIEINEKVYISDDYKFLLDKLPHYEINSIEYNYWGKHDHTTGGDTLFKGLKKFRPATINTFKDSSYQVDLYFKNLEEQQNNQLHTKKVFEDLDETFNTLKKTNKKIVLMFSGGKDSCLLAQFLKKYDIDFTPIFLKIEPTYNQAFLDLQKVKQVSKAIDIDTKIIKVKIDAFEAQESNKIHELQLMDKHFTPVHFKGVEEIINNFGKDVLILNGSTSDSIFTYGPSESSRISFLRRNIMFNPKAIISKIAVALLNIKTKKRFRIGKTIDEQLLALMDEYKYCRVLDSDESEEYYSYLLEKLSFSREKLSEYNSLEMYAKNLTFLQGSTQQIVHNSCKYHGVKYIMPFASPQIIYATMANRDRKLEINKPKYCVERILKDKFNFDYNQVKLNFIDQKFDYNLDELREKVNKEYENSLERLTK